MATLEAMERGREGGGVGESAMGGSGARVARRGRLAGCSGPCASGGASKGSLEAGESWREGTRVREKEVDWRREGFLFPTPSCC